MDTGLSTPASRVIEFLCRHLVALCVTYVECDESGPKGKPRFFACPGTILVVRGVGLFLTAGHTLQRWDEPLKQGRVQVISAVLADTFGSERVTEEPIPFDFVNAPRFYIDDDDEGLDFGVISLRPYYLQLLAKNGIKAILEENWAVQHKVDFDAYIMLGLPDDDDFITSQITVLGDKVHAVGSVSPTIIRLQRLAQPPAGKEKHFPRFVGQLDRDLPLTSITGMSGGPIFGFRFGPPILYWVVAIQSSWLRESRVTFGCPMPIVGELITAWLDEARKQIEPGSRP